MELPSLQTLPLSTLMAGGCGFIYGRIFQANACLAAKAFALAMLADNLLYQSSNGLLGNGTRRRSEMIYTCTSLAAGAASMLALRHLELIGARGTILLSAMHALALAGRIHRLQQT